MESLVYFYWDGDVLKDTAISIFFFNCNPKK